MKNIKLIVLIFVSTALLWGAVIQSLQNSVLIESFESKTGQGGPVFNRISFSSQGATDVWTMKQSHEGLKASPHTWDTIRITVDKQKKIVRYQQLENEKEVELKATCYTCHANGPRAIRPNWKSMDVTYSLKDRLSIALMNLRIKSYGKLQLEEKNFKLNQNLRAMPLKFLGKIDNTPLEVRSCTLCHNNDTFWGRGLLVRQQAGTIQHLVKTNQMPPWPFKLSPDDKKNLERFVVQ